MRTLFSQSMKMQYRITRFALAKNPNPNPGERKYPPLYWKVILLTVVDPLMSNRAVALVVTIVTRPGVPAPTWGLPLVSSPCRTNVLEDVVKTCVCAGQGDQDALVVWLHR